MLFVIRTGPNLCVGGAVDVLHSNSLSDLSEATDLATHLPRADVVNQEVEQRPTQQQTRYLIPAGRLLSLAASHIRHEAV